MVALVVAALVVVFVVIPRLPAPDWSWRVERRPVPSTPGRGRLVAREVLEQVALLTLLCTIFASILPGIDATGLQIAVGVAAIVLANAAINVAAPPALLAANLGLVYLANALLGERRDFELDIGLLLRVPDHAAHESSGCTSRLPAGVPPSRGIAPVQARLLRLSAQCA